MAYLTDSEMTDNTVTVGKVKIELEEPNYPGNDSDIVKTIIPNQVIAKDPQVENSGNNTALVYLKVEVPQEDITALDENNNKGTKQTQDLFTLKDVSSQWELIRTETSTDQTTGKSKTSYVYAYKKPLAPGSTSDKLFQNVQVKNFIEKDIESNVEDIVITAGAIQSTNVSDIDLTPQGDGTIPKEKLDNVYDIFLNQSGDKTNRQADKGDRNLHGKLGNIIYELDGGTLADGSLTEYGNADYGYVPPEPTKEDYTFVGWNPVSIPENSTGNITMTAKWKSPTANLSYNLASLIEKIAIDKTQITAIQRSTLRPDESITNDNAHIISNINSDAQVYLWKDGTMLKWWSEAAHPKAPSSIDKLFYKFTNLTDISGLADWDVSNVTNMNFAFNHCTKLANLTPLENWNTKNVQSTENMFSICKSLTDLTPLCNWDVKNVHEMNVMFAGSGISSLSGLQRLFIDGSAEVTTSGMFYGCKNLTDLTAIKNWNTSNFDDMTYMFGNCISLTSLNGLENFKFNSGTYNGSIEGMFGHTDDIIEDGDDGCINLTDISALENWNTESLTSIDGLFSGCSSLSDISVLSKWDVSNVQWMIDTFGSSGVSDLSPLANWNTGKAYYMNYMFDNCTNITDASPINDWDISNVVALNHMFSNCPSHPEFTKRKGSWNNGTFTPAT